jgi:hypothetical protein
MIESTKPDVFLLNVTNIALGVGFLICLALIAGGIIRDFWERFHKPPKVQHSVSIGIRSPATSTR